MFRKATPEPSQTTMVEERQPAIQEMMSEPISPPPTAEPTPSELERLRDILYGPQSRTTSKRLEELEARLAQTRQELRDLLHERDTAVAETADHATTTLRRELTSKLAEQSSSQTAALQQAQQTLTSKLEGQGRDLTDQLRATQRQLTERLDGHESEQAVALRTIQQEFNDRLSQLAANFLNQLNTTHSELSAQIEQLRQEQTQRWRTLQTELRQRDDTLRQDLAAQGMSLEQKKTSRQELAHLLLEVSQRLSDE